TLSSSHRLSAVRSAHRVPAAVVESVSATPEEQTVVIEPSHGLFHVDRGAFWHFRELLFFLVWRDVKIRYKQTAIGVAWAILQPLLTMLIFTLFFGRLAGVPSDNIPYPIFAYAGLLPWTFFANAISNSGNSLVGN